jgi:hypothetical protein
MKIEKERALCSKKKKNPNAEQNNHAVLIWLFLNVLLAA